MISLSRDISNKDVRRNKKYEDVVNILVNGRLSNNTQAPGKKVFNYIKDLMVFAAMVGKRHERRESVEKDNIGITLHTYSGDGGRNSITDQHNIIFMFGLLYYKDMNYLRNEKIDESIKLFEEYSNGGLSLIKEWLIESSWDSLCILEKIHDQASEEKPSGITIKENPF